MFIDFIIPRIDKTPLGVTCYAHFLVPGHMWDIVCSNGTKTSLSVNTELFYFQNQHRLVILL